MQFDVDQKAEELLRVFSPGAGHVQKEIFRRFLYRIYNHFKETLGEADFLSLNPEKFLLNKSLTFFLPYYCLLRSPFYLPDIEQAIAIIKQAFEKKETTRIVLYGDRDADGISSSAILYLFLVEQMKFDPARVTVLLPRQEDKYGITEEVSQRILSLQPDILITLDCGSSNKDTLASITQNRPVKIIVIDHHFIPADTADYPQVDAFINPKRLPVGSPEHDLCTAGIAMKIIWGLTYSFTSEYNLVNRVIDNGGMLEYTKNGVVINETTHDRDIIFHGDAPESPDTINALQWWVDATRQNKQLHRLNQVDQSLGGFLTASEKFVILQNLKFTNIFQKVRRYYPLAAVGTVADMMPLLDDNRILVAFGLLLAGGSDVPRGLAELLKISGIKDRPVTEQDLGFSVCPAINAAGRLGDPVPAFDLLVESDPIESVKKAFKLKEINEERKRLSKEGFTRLEDSLGDEHESHPMVIAYHPEVHRGISGLVASRMAEAHKKPAMVLVEDGDCLRGSIRSYHNEDVFSFLTSLSEHLLQFGGHRQAAGFSLAHEKKDDFIQAAYARADEYEGFNANTLITKDMVITNRDFGEPLPVNDNEILSKSWHEWLSFAPYGILNPHPVVAIRPTADIRFETMGEDHDHARLNFSGIADSSIEGVWFFHGEDSLAGSSRQKPGKIIAEPHLNYFAGKLKYQLRVTQIDEFNP